MSAISVHVHGASGRMGSAVVAAVQGAADMELRSRSGRGDDLAAMLSGRPVEVMVDFTVAGAAPVAIAAALRAGAHVVSGTTGLPVAAVDDLAALAQERARGLLLAPNFAIGVILLQRFCREAARWFGDVEVVEMHHERKRDAPSGTALHTARQIAAAAGRPVNADRPAVEDLAPGARGAAVDGVPVHAVRLPGLLAHQEVLFGAPGQLLTVRHDTLDRQAFMPGVLLAIRAIRERRGLVDSLEHLLDDGATP